MWHSFKTKKHWYILIILKNELHHLNFVVLKIFAYNKVFCEMFFFFFFKNFSQGNFLYCQIFVISKNLNTACTLTEIKQKLLLFFFFFFFFRKDFFSVFSSYWTSVISLIEYSLFLCHWRSVFLMIGSEKRKLYWCFFPKGS